MAKRTCDACGSEKDVSGGKTCERGHFICRSCLDLGFFGGTRKKCPLDDKPLR
jgi:hypothetical protein